MLAFLFLLPLDASAEPRRKRRVETTPSQQAAQPAAVAEPGSSSTKANAPQRKKRENSVTAETREVARNASQSSNGKGPAKPQITQAPKKQPTIKKLPVMKPDLDEIRTATLNPKGPYYFPNLVEKYNRKDTTSMRPQDYRYLYLGYMFQEDYDPYRSSPFTLKTDSLRQLPQLTRKDKEQIKYYAEKALEDNPFDLRQMSLLIHVLKELNKNNSAEIWTHRLESLINAIQSTGTGLNKDNAWFVIYPVHEYDMIQLLGYEAVDVDYLDPGFDLLKVRPDGSKTIRNKVDGFFFNIQVPQQQYELKHPEDMEDAGASGMENAESD